MRLLLLVLAQALLLAWMYYRTLWRNCVHLRYYIAHQLDAQRNPDGSIWVRGGTGTRGFRLCCHCVEAVLHSGALPE